MKEGSVRERTPFVYSNAISACPDRICRHPRQAGFTITEIVVTISIIGLLAAVAIPRFLSSDAFASRGFHDEAIGVVRYAQKTAIAWRRPVFVCVTSTEVRAGAVPGCATALPHPGTGGDLVAAAPNGVTLAPVGGFTFDGLGRPNVPATITFSSTISGDPARRIAVQAETGYVHP
jgi:MSHA pilin protein MshC